MSLTITPEPEHVRHGINWLWSLCATPLIAFWKQITEGIKSWIKWAMTPKERREDVITRAEFEARHAELDKHFREGFVDLGDKLMAHGAQARIDNRELKAELKADIGNIRTDVKETGRDLFQKMDNFLAMISMRHEK